MPILKPKILKRQGPLAFLSQLAGQAQLERMPKRKQQPVAQTWLNTIRRQVEQNTAGIAFPQLVDLEGLQLADLQ